MSTSFIVGNAVACVEGCLEGGVDGGGGVDGVGGRHGAGDLLAFCFGEEGERYPRLRIARRRDLMKSIVVG